MKIQCRIPSEFYGPCKNAICTVKENGMAFLNREYEAFIIGVIGLKVIMFFQISQQSRIDLDQENLCPVFA